MLINEESLTHWIDNFYGYGSWHARFWFVSYEEGGGELPEEVADKINYFIGVRQQPAGALCDIRELYRHVAFRWEGPKANLFSTLHEYRFEQNAIQHGVWKNLISFVHGYSDEKLPDVLAYQQHQFASPSAQREALIPLYPLPSPHSHSWYYSWLDLPQLPFLKNRTLYQDHVYKRRIQTILSNIPTYHPEVILMYGMSNIAALKKSVHDFFPNVKFRLIKATRQVIPQYHQADLNGTMLLITTQIPALRHNRVETGFDWEEFGKRLAVS